MNNKLKRITFCVFTLLIVVGTGICAQNKSKHRGVVIGDNLRVREKPSLKAGIVDVLFKGNQVEISNRIKGDAYKGNLWWYKINIGHNRAYIHSSFVFVNKSASTYLKNFKIRHHDKRLSKWVHSPKKEKQIKKYHRLFTEARTDKELSKAYTLSKHVRKDLAPYVDKEFDKTTSKAPYMKVRWIFVYLRGLDYFLVAEGTRTIIQPVFFEYLRRAKKTKGSSDDLFFSMMVDAYGTFKHWGNWFNQTWDYGGRSNLGSGLHLKLLKKSDIALKKSNLFKVDIVKLRISLFSDIYKSLAYGKSKSEIIKELKNIVKEVNLSAKEKTLLHKRILEFSSPTSKIQVGCDKKRCNEGG